MHSNTLRVRRDNGGTPKADGWGVDSEYGILRDVLLGPPESFRWTEGNAQFSALARATLRSGERFDTQLAMRQHREMVQAYEDAGVKVHVLDCEQHLPLQVFARDSNFMTPYGAVVCQLANPRRRGEYASVLRFYMSNGIPIYELVSAGNFEGGDFNIIRPGCVLVGYTGLRTEEESARQVGGWFEAEGWEVRYAPIDEYYVHIDLMVCMLAENLAAVCLDTTDPDIVTWLKGKGIEIVPVSFRDTMALGCNVMALGNDRVLSSAGSPELNARLRALGFEVYDPDVSMFTKGGGGIHCMAQPLRRDPVAA
jgi:N-dimethylarginine dimethylaminohydrolase